jgi:hypothetical protein
MHRPLFEVLQGPMHVVNVQLEAPSNCLKETIANVSSFPYV